MLKNFLLLSLLINFSNSYFKFTIELRDKFYSFNPFKTFQKKLDIKSNTELNIEAFISKNSSTPSSISIRHISSKYSIDYSNYGISNLTLIIHTSLTNLNEMFLDGDQLNSIKLESYNEKVIDMENMFSKCTGLQFVDFSEFDLTEVTSFKGLFENCIGLSEVIFGEQLITNLLNMEKMFYGCYSGDLKLDLSNLDTSKVTNMYGLFYNNNYLKYINLSNFNTSKVTNFSYMFYQNYYLTELDITNFDTSNAKDMSGMFTNCKRLTYLNISNFNTSSVLSMDYMFQGCGSLTSLNVSNFDTSKVTSMISMFYTYISLDPSIKVPESALKILDLTNFNTSLVTSMNRMFYNSKNLYKLNIKNFDTSSVTDMTYMFSGCESLTTLDISNFSGEKVTNTSYMFEKCTFLISLNFDNFKAKEIKDMGYMFSNCRCLTSLNLIHFDTSLVTNMKQMFYECKFLSYLCINNFSTKNVLNMNQMFSGCISLVSLNLSKFEIGDTDIDFKKILNPISDNLIYCIKDDTYEKIKSEIENKDCIIRDNNCINNWSKNSYKYIEGTSICIPECNLTDNYKYEYNGKCYSSCPKGTTSLYNDNFLCEEFSQIKFITNEELKKINNMINNTELNIDYRDILKICQPTDFLKDKCKPIKYNSNMVEMIKNSIKDGLMDDLLNEVVNEKKLDIYNEDDNIKYVVTSLYNQRNKNYENISVLNISYQCEMNLKQIYNINPNDTLIIFKYDYSIKGLLIPIVGYEIYHPITKELLNISYCNDTKIDIIIPVNINENKLYKYDPKNEYYKNKCNSYPNEKNVDMTLYDRKKEFNEKNLSLCSKNCEYVEYNNITKKAICQCEPQYNSSLITLDNIINKKKLLNNFLDIKATSNIAIIKCYNIFFSKVGFKNNIGSYLLIIILIIFIAGLISFILKGNKLLNDQIDIIAKSSEDNNKTLKFEENKQIKVAKNHFDNMSSISTQKKSKNKNKNKKKENRTKTQPNLISFDYQGKNDDKKNVKSNIIDSNLSFMPIKKNKKGIIKIKNKNNNKKKEKKYNDSELNIFDYEEAEQFDKRTYFNIYFSLIKTKHPLISSFYPHDNYNLISIKICLLFFSFGLSLTINSLFFTDETMHKIYEDEGIFNFVYSLPKIIYSTLISTLINIIIKKLASSEDIILKVKKEKKLAKKNKKILKIQFSLFFSIGFILLGLCWFYIGCFCAVYNNTQIYLLEDTLISFDITIIIPFIKFLITSLIRINSLKKPGKCLYSISKFIQ